MTTNDRNDRAGDHLFIRETLTVNLRSHQGVDKAAVGAPAQLLHAIDNITLHILKTLYDLGYAIGMVLEIAMHFSDIVYPGPEFPMIFHGDAHQLRRHDRRQ